MKELSFDEMVDTMGGISRAEYCEGLYELATGGGYQGDWQVFKNAWNSNCAAYGY